MIAVHPAETARWDDVRAVFGTKGDPSWCFCQYFADPEWNRGKDANLRSLKSQVAQCDPPAGLIAYADDEPVGWVQVGPRDRFPRLNARHEPQDGEWFLTCFVVRVGHRRQGVSAALLAAAVEHARAHGARTLRARPTDTSAGKRPGADLFTGVLSTFAAAGFHEVRRNHSRVTVELDLTRPGGQRT